MANDDAPKTESSGDGAQEDASPKRSLTGQIRNEAIVQSANLFLVARRILTTSLGAIALSIEETNEFIERLVERGEVAEHELTAMIDEMSGQITARGKSLVQRTPALPEVAVSTRTGESGEEGISLSLAADVPASPERTSALLGDRVESILGRLNVPTRNDIENLTSKIELLSGKVLLLRSRSQRSVQANTGSAPNEVETVEESG